MPGGRPKKIVSWDGKEESHPFRRYPETDNKATRLILGSFPPNKFTNYKDRQTKCDKEFFYGSRDNVFWDLFVFAKELGFKWPDDFELLTSWIKNNNWVVSDIILKSTRKKDTATDNDLQPIEWNIQIINQIVQKNPIKIIYFTSNWVRNNFDKHVKPKLKTSEQFQDIVLISPSPAGLISTNWARKILKKSEMESLEEYRIRYYKIMLNSV